MREGHETGGTKRFEYSKEDLERIRNSETESSLEFKKAYKHWKEHPEQYWLKNN
jgi:hypothetical protein